MDDASTTEQYRRALEAAHREALRWLDSLPDRLIRPEADADAILARLERTLPETGASPTAVVQELAEAAEPGLIALGSPRFFGLVIGGTYPAALAADWLASAWDQNNGARQLTPATAAVEEVAAAWLLELLGLPAGSGVGFVTGGTIANFACLVAARDEVVRRAGGDPAAGLQRAPEVRPEQHVGLAHVPPAGDRRAVEHHALGQQLRRDPGGGKLLAGGELADVGEQRLLGRLSGRSILRQA